MRHLAGILIRFPRGPNTSAACLAAVVCLCLAIGCAGTRYGSNPPGPAADPAAESTPIPYQFDFVDIFDNVRSAPYFPIEGIGGVAFGDDGTLYFCDAKGGRVFGQDPVSLDWFQFDAPGRRFYQPVDVRVDGFNVLVLDLDAQTLLRYDLGGVFLDRLLNFVHLDPGYNRYPSAFDIDLDGRMVFTDGAEDQAFMLDSFLQPQEAIGEPGSHQEQFNQPSGVAYLPAGGFVVADRGNRRLQYFSRLGYFDGLVGGEFDVENPLLTPQGIDIDDWGNVFVADPAGGAIHVFTAARELSFSLRGELGLVASPEAPIDVALGPDDLVAVSDRGRQAILIYRIFYR